MELPSIVLSRYFARYQKIYFFKKINKCCSRLRSDILFNIIAGYNSNIFTSFVLKCVGKYAPNIDFGKYIYFTLKYQTLLWFITYMTNYFY